MDEGVQKAVADTLAGDTEAYALIVSTYTGKLLASAVYLTGSRADAEDLVQETLIDGFLHLSTLRDPTRLEGWLMRILKNKALNHLMRRSRTESEDVLAGLSTGKTPETVYIHRESLGEWRLRLDSLPPSLRETAVQYFWQDLSMDDIAKRSKIPLGTVKRRIHDAREKLKKEYRMEEYKNITHDALIKLITKKIEELSSYEKLYGSKDGFDRAYSEAKALIDSLPDKEEKKKFALEGADIAIKTDKKKYCEDVLALCREHGAVSEASRLHLDLCWELRDNAEKLKYTEATVIPELMKYSENSARNSELGYHYFWCFMYNHFIDGRSEESLSACEAAIAKAKEYYSRTTDIDSMHGAVIAALKVPELMRAEDEQKDFAITGELWQIEDGNIYYYNQPGYTLHSELNRYSASIFYYAGCYGDRYFFPHGEICVGERETLVNKGINVGRREVVSLTEVVETPAGVFNNCVHLRKCVNKSDIVDTWYKDGVGLVRFEMSCAPHYTKVLSAYEIKGGEGLLPTAIGNRWSYETPDRPEVLIERHEYVIEEAGKHDGKDAFSLSCLNYVALAADWEERSEYPELRFIKASALCKEQRYAKAADCLRNVIMSNTDRESVDIALSMLEYLEEKLPYDELKWRFCPSSANISTLALGGGGIIYDEGGIEAFETGVWGTRGAENRIFGVKPFRYLQALLGTLWDERFNVGFCQTLPHENRPDVKIKINVTDGGMIETPAGVFENTVHLTLDVDNEKEPITKFFYNCTDCGVKEYWFAKGVGIVRFKCTWGKALTSDALLTEYRTVSQSGEMLPIHIGNRWRYEEQGLTSEGYIARRDYKVISGMGGRYLLADHQMFTFKGDVAAYDEFKAGVEKK